MPFKGEKDNMDSGNVYGNSKRGHRALNSSESWFSDLNKGVMGERRELNVRIGR